MGPPVYNPGQPSMTPIPGGFAPGKILHVTGTFTPTANSFIMKLQSGQVGDPTDEIGLCIYGRVAEGVIGRNAFTRAAGWGQEEATSSPAFARGQNFDITILCDPAQFKIALNQNHFAEFNHRTNPASLNFLNITSTSQDVTVACIWIEDGPGAPQTQAGFAPSPISGFEPRRHTLGVPDLPRHIPVPSHTSRFPKLPAAGATTAVHATRSPITAVWCRSKVLAGLALPPEPSFLALSKEYIFCSVNHRYSHSAFHNRLRPIQDHLLCTLAKICKFIFDNI
uniref:Galectin n=1 Tax=Scylla paramamosain TaxID=85552 RepID=A0A649ZV01_SCYPA|nr:galectin [Scylla paramamosain]